MDQERWISADQFDIGAVRLTQDGTIHLGDLAFDQGTAICNVGIDRVRANKQGGTGELLTLQDKQGTLSARYDADQSTWHVRHSDPKWQAKLEQKAHASMRSASFAAQGTQTQASRPRTPAPVPQTPYPVPGPLVSPPSKTGSLIATVVVICILALLALVALREPATKLAEGWAAERKQEALRRQQEAEYRTLEEAVRPNNTEVTDRFRALQALAASFFPKVEELADRSLDRLTADPPEVPTAIRDTYRFVDEFREPWNDILNAYRATQGFADNTQQTLNDMAKRTEKKRLRKEDLTTLTGLLEDMIKLQGRIEAQRKNLDSVRRILARREIDAFSTTKGRSLP